MEGGFVQWKRSCWYCKTPFGSHIPEETDERFQFVCFHQGVFFFYLGMRSRSALSNQILMITQCLSASWVIFWNLWQFLTSVINCINIGKSGQPWNLLIPLLFLFLLSALLIVGFIYQMFSLVQMLSKQILQQVKWWRLLFHTSGNACQIDNIHILSFQLGFCPVLMKEQRKG